MALGLLGARGERHVHRRRSACDRLHSCGVWRRPRPGRGRLWCGRRWRPEEEEMTLKASPPPHSRTAAPPGKAPGGTLLSGVTAVGGEGLAP